MIALNIGRPVAILDRDFHLEYPIDLTDEALDEWDRNSSAGPPPTTISSVSVITSNASLSEIFYTLSAELFSAQAVSLPIRDVMNTLRKVRRRLEECECESTEMETIGLHSETRGP